MYSLFSSAPEFDMIQGQNPASSATPPQHGSVLRKTNSQPHSTMHSTLPPTGKRSGKGGGDVAKQESLKYTRTPSSDSNKTSGAAVDKVKNEHSKKTGSGGGSPQQTKRNFFAGLKNSLLSSSSKSRSQEDLSRMTSASGAAAEHAGSGHGGGGGGGADSRLIGNSHKVAANECEAETAAKANSRSEFSIVCLLLSSAEPLINDVHL